jgi:archaellin
MNRAIKGISAGIIIIAFVFGAIVAWKIVDNIRQSFRQGLQESFKESLNEYGKR